MPFRDIVQPNLFNLLENEFSVANIIFIPLVFSYWQRRCNELVIWSYPKRLNGPSLRMGLPYVGLQDCALIRPYSSIFLLKYITNDEKNNFLDSILSLAFDKLF